MIYICMYIFVCKFICMHAATRKYSTPSQRYVSANWEKYTDESFIFGKNPQKLNCYESRIRFISYAIMRSTALENRTLHYLVKTFLYYSYRFTFRNNSHERRLFFLIQQIITVEFSLEVVISLPQASLPRASWELLAATKLRMDECHRARPRAHAPFSWS